MSSYLPLLNVSVEHNFFSDGVCSGLDFVPKRQSEMIAGNAGLLIRQTLNGVRVFYDEDRADALALYATQPNQSLMLIFRVFSTDHCFSNYTEPAFYKERSILYFSNQEMVTDTDGRFRLHGTEYASELDFEPMGSPRVDEILDNADNRRRPAFIVAINISKINVSASSRQSTEIPEYFIRFDTRKTFWKYYLLGGMARKDTYISSSDKNVEFEYIGRKQLMNGINASIFRSKTPMPLRNEVDYRFQLRETASGNGKILIKRLPVASATQIYREMIDEKQVLISEIYVNC